MIKEHVYSQLEQTLFQLVHSSSWHNQTNKEFRQQNSDQNYLVQTKWNGRILPGNTKPDLGKRDPENCLRGGCEDRHWHQDSRDWRNITEEPTRQDKRQTEPTREPMSTEWRWGEELGLMPWPNIWRYTIQKESLTQASLSSRSTPPLQKHWRDKPWKESE